MSLTQLLLRDAATAPRPPGEARPILAIQARMGSSRFPGKVMASLGRSTVLDWVYERANASTSRSQTWILTSEAERDNAIEQWAARSNIPCLRGSEDDVLSRYVDLCRRERPRAVVRVTADCPLIDPEVIDSVIAGWWRTGDPAEYSSNILRRTFPDGLDVEVISAEVLERLDVDASGDHREHVTSYIIENPASFDCVSVELDVDCSSARVTLDTPRDLEVLEELVAGAAHPLDGPMLGAVLAHFGCRES